MAMHGLAARNLASLALLVCLTAACSPSAPPAASTNGATAASATALQQAPAAAATRDAGTRAEAPASNELIRIAHLGGGTDSGIILAEALGYYREQGLNVELTVVPGVNEGLPLLATNQIQALGGAPSASIFNAIGRGVGLRIVADRGQVQPDRSIAPLIARKELQGQINGPADLFGRRIAVNGQAGSSSVAIHRYVTDAGLNFQDLEIVIVPYPDMVPALGSGQVDIAAVVEPFASGAVGGDIGIQVIDEYVMFPNHQTGVLMYASDFIDKRVEDARRLAVAYLKGNRAYLDAFGPNRINREQVVRALIEHTRLKDPALYEIMAPLPFESNGEVNLASLEYDLNYFVGNGYVREKPTIAETVDFRFIEHALSTLGRR